MDRRMGGDFPTCSTLCILELQKQNDMRKYYSHTLMVLLSFYLGISSAETHCQQ